MTRHFRSRFTLLELLIAMALMILLMLAIVTIFATAMDIFTKSKAKMEVYQNARTTLNMMERDIYGMLSYKSLVQELVTNVDADSRPAIPADPPDPAEPPFLAFATNTTYIDNGPPATRLIGPVYIEYVVEGSSLPAAFPYYQLRRKVKTISGSPRTIISEEAIAQFILPLDPAGGSGTSGQPSIKLEAISAPDAAPPAIVDPGYVPGSSISWHTPSVAPGPYLPKAFRITMDMIDPQNRECRTISSTIWVPASTQ